MNENSTLRDNLLKEWKDALNQLKMTKRKSQKTQWCLTRERTKDYNYVPHDVNKLIENNTTSSENGQLKTNHQLSK